MTFIFDKTTWTVTDTDTGVVVRSLGTSVGPNGERGRGVRVEISWEQRWGGEKAIAHLFRTKVFSDPYHVDVHYKLFRIYIPPALMPREQEVVFMLESCMQHYPTTSNSEVWGKFTTDFSSYSKVKEFLLAW